MKCGTNRGKRLVALAVFALLFFLMIPESVHAASVIEEPLPITTTTSIRSGSVVPIEESLGEISIKQDAVAKVLSDIRERQATISVYGTEYVLGDFATVFLQLLNSYGSPINNASCFIDVYYPGSVTHPNWLNDQMMSFKEEGLYYYDLAVPNFTGVYMTTVKCSFNSTIKYYSGFSSCMGLNVNQGTFTGDICSLNEFDDGLYARFQGSGAPSSTSANFSWSGVSLANVSTLVFNVWGESIAANTNIWVSAFNHSSNSFVVIGFVQFSGTATAGEQGVTFQDEHFSFAFPGNLSNFVNASGGVKVRLNTTGGGSGGDIWYNAIYLSALSSAPTYSQEIRGSGELHVSQPIALEISSKFSILAAAFWIAVLLLLLYVLWRFLR